MPSSLLISLLVHGSLLSLTFGGQGLGLPGLGFPWQQRRIEAPDLRVLLVPAPGALAEPAVDAPATPAQRAPTEPPAARGPAPTPLASPAPPPTRAAIEVMPAATPKAGATPERNAVVPAAPATARGRAAESMYVAPAPVPEPPANDVKPPGRPTPAAPAAPAAQGSQITEAPGAARPRTEAPAHRDAGPAARERIGQDVRQRAAEFAKRADQLAAARIEAAKVKTDLLEKSARIEAARQDAARQEAGRAEAARLEAQRQEAARFAAAQLDAQRQEAARQEAAREEAARAEAARLEAQRQEAARQAAARQESARIEAEKEEDAIREARRRAIGRQLDEEADRREAASKAARDPSTLPLSLSTARRVRLWGRADPNVELVRYAEQWARKIQFNTPVETVREVAKQPHTDPMVTVAIRSDGSVESVTFVVSSGVAAIDEAIRRIVHSHEHYVAFPPALAREYDVIEIRRTWYFDVAVRLY
jgi:hypothetical protein